MKHISVPALLLSVALTLAFGPGPAFAQTWARTYGGGFIDAAHSTQQTTDGGFVVAGWTSSFGAGDYDFLVLKLDASGNTQWQKTYGATLADVA